jgi:hypothetical protein
MPETPYISALPKPIYTDVRYFYGDPGVPRDVREMRVSTMETMRRMGTPVLLKRLYTVRDYDNGRALRSPAWDDDYKQVRGHDPLSHGVGFVGPDLSPTEWYDPVTFEVFDNPNIHDPNGLPLPAPLYRGYGPGFLTYVILPDRAEDVFKLDSRGVLTRMQDAHVQLPWWPLVGDNDLMITVQINDQGFVVDSFERYQLKQVQPVTMRGSEQNNGAREFSGANAGGNRWWIGQECESVKVPNADPVYDVEIDR